MIDKDKFLREMAIERNNYADDCNRRVEREYGKIEGADYILNRMLELLREQNCEADTKEDKATRPKGRWEFDEKGYFSCSECKRKPKDQTDITDFCPHCGADMREESEVENESRSVKVF